MFIERFSRRALVAAVVTLGAARADAQQACTAATAGQYAAEGFACRIGDWLFDHFSFGTWENAGPGSAAQAGTESSVFVSPFAGVDALGRATFGFDFDGFTAAAQLGAGPDAYTDALLYFDFHVASLDPAVALGGGRVVGTQQAAGGGTYSGLMALVAALYPQPQNDCVNVRQLVQSPADLAVDLSTACPDAALPRRGAATVQAWAQGWSADVPGLAAAAPFASTTVTRLELVAAPTSTVPEPATALLVGAGLLAVGGVARRRA